MTAQRKFAFLSLGILLAVAPVLWILLSPPEVYQTCREIEGFFRETIELKAGRFRYWQYSDAGGGVAESEPLEGRATVEGNRLVLHHEKLGEDGVRILDEIRGRKVLWRPSAWEEWKKSSRIHFYGISIRRGSSDLRPSIYELYTPEMVQRERTIRKDALSDVPGEVGALLRAAKGDVSETDAQHAARADAYRSLLKNAREKLDPVLVGRLVALLGYDSEHSAVAERVLNDLYLPGGRPAGAVDKEVPRPAGISPELRRALAPLIDACASAGDSRALERTLQVFLRASGIARVNLPIPKVGVRVFIEILPDGCKSSLGNLEDCSTHPRDYRWREHMEYIVSVCQDWMRHQLGEQ